MFFDSVAHMCYNVGMTTKGSMAKSVEVRARIDPDTKLAAEAVFGRLGMSSSEAIRVFYHQVLLRQGLPFEVHIPNEETERALKDTLNGDGLGPRQTLEAFNASLDQL